MKLTDRITTFDNLYLNDLYDSADQPGRTPFTPGENFLLRAYFETNDYGLTRLTVTNMPFDYDCEDFFNALAETDITEWVLADQSTGLMDSLHAAMSAGWAPAETFTHQRNAYSTLRGLVMRRA